MLLRASVDARDQRSRLQPTTDHFSLITWESGYHGRGGGVGRGLGLGVGIGLTVGVGVELGVEVAVGVGVAVAVAVAVGLGDGVGVGVPCGTELTAAKASTLPYPNELFGMVVLGIPPQV